MAVLFEVYRVPFEAGQVSFVGGEEGLVVVVVVVEEVVADLVFVDTAEVAGLEAVFVLMTGTLGGRAAVDVFGLGLIMGCFGGLGAEDLVVFAVEVDDLLVWLVVDVVVAVEEEIDFELVVDFVVWLEVETVLELEADTVLVLLEDVRNELD